MSYVSWFGVATALTGCQASTPSAPAVPATQAPQPETSPSPVAMEQPSSTENLRAVRIPIHAADAHQIANAVKDIFDLRARPRGHVRAVFVDRSEDGLVVIGTEQGIAQVRALLTPDVIADDDRPVAVIALRYTEAHKLIHTVQPMFQDVVMLADTPTNSIVVQAPSEQQERVAQLIARIDKPQAQPAKAPRP